MKGPPAGQGQILLPMILLLPGLVMVFVLSVEAAKLSRGKVRAQAALDLAAFTLMDQNTSLLNRVAYLNHSFPRRVLEEQLGTQEIWVEHYVPGPPPRRWSHLVWSLEHPLNWSWITDADEAKKYKETFAGRAPCEEDMVLNPMICPMGALSLGEALRMFNLVYQTYFNTAAIAHAYIDEVKHFHESAQRLSTLIYGLNLASPPPPGVLLPDVWLPEPEPWPAPFGISEEYRPIEWVSCHAKAYDLGPVETSLKIPPIDLGEGLRIYTALKIKDYEALRRGFGFFRYWIAPSNVYGRTFHPYLHARVHTTPAAAGAAPPYPARVKPPGVTGGPPFWSGWSLAEPEEPPRGEYYWPQSASFGTRLTP